MTNSAGNSFGPFEPTHWPLVEQAAHSNPVFRHAALTELLERYRPALRAHLVFKRQLDRQAAEDVLQGFISDKILERNILRLADQSKGQFRLLMLKSLDNYLRDEWRRAACRKETDVAIDEREEPATPENAADVFDIAWARQVLTHVLTRMRSDCESAGRLNVWEIFLSRVWLAAVTGRELESYDSLVARLGLESPAQASNLLMTAKRQFRRTLEDSIAEYAVEPSAIMLEVAELQRILAIGRDVLVALPFDQLTDTPPLAECSPGSDQNIDVSLAWPCEFQLAAEDAVTWNDRDLASLLRHQLNLPLSHLASLVLPAESSNLEVDNSQPCATLSELFAATNPSVSILRQVKDVCKLLARSSDAPIPKEVAIVLYYAAIATTLLRTNESISTSSSESLSEGLFRVLAIPWCTPELRRLFAEAHLAVRS